MATRGEACMKLAQDLRDLATRCKDDHWDWRRDDRR